MAENVKVIVRCRPMSKKEEEMKCKKIITIADCAVSIENPMDLSTPAKQFTYDCAYDSLAPTEAIYNDICYSLIENVLEGYNGTIFAYGQTGCGKSHTMQGSDQPAINGMLPVNHQSATAATAAAAAVAVSSQRGIISRSFDHIFEAISVCSGTRYLAIISYLEIYNENIRDLLNPNGAATTATSLTLKELPGDGIIIQNLSTHTVHNAMECEHFLNMGTKNRIVGATQMNATSSRSHSIFTISLEQIGTSSKLADDEQPSIKKGKLNLVDLAGSERQNKTGATGDRLKEATKINLSLSALGNVISALIDDKSKHIPYRDSKLTRLLQDSLGGNTKTLMIACISPAAYNYDETLSTLRYANRAKMIHNKPKINEDPKDTILREYQEEIVRLKKMLESNPSLSLSPSLSSSVPAAAVAVDHQQNTKQNPIGHRLDESELPVNNPTIDDPLVEHLEIEKNRLKEMFAEETKRLKSEHAAQQKEKEDLVKDMENLRLHYENQLKQLINEQQQPMPPEPPPPPPSITANDQDDHRNHRQLTNEKNDVLEKIQQIKNSLIGGERSNDTQLKEKRNKKKMAAEMRLTALATALSRIEQTADRDMLQGHYTDQQHELAVKSESLKLHRQKVKALEREITDLQSEFQLDRTDYLETIRRLEKDAKFYVQLLDKALPLLRKDGRFWDIDQIKMNAKWNDDLNKWKLPEDSIGKLKLPPAAVQSQFMFYNHNHPHPHNHNKNNKNSSLTVAADRIQSSQHSNSSKKFKSKSNSFLTKPSIESLNSSSSSSLPSSPSSPSSSPTSKILTATTDNNPINHSLQMRVTPSKIPPSSILEHRILSYDGDNDDDEEPNNHMKVIKKLKSGYDGNDDIADSYFRPRRAAQLLQQNRIINYLKDTVAINRNQRNLINGYHNHPSLNNNNNNNNNNNGKLNNSNNGLNAIRSTSTTPINGITPKMDTH